MRGGGQGQGGEANKGLISVRRFYILDFGFNCGLVNRGSLIVELKKSVNQR